MKKRYDTIFLDRDGTLNPDPGYISKLSDFSFYNFAIPALVKLTQIGNRFCIVTNQSGVKRGLIQQESLDEIHSYIKTIFLEHNIPLVGIYVCIDLPNSASERRKPETGMFLEASNAHNIDLKKSLMIGDSFVDIEVGKKLNMDTLLVLTGVGEKTLKSLSQSTQPTFIEDNIYSFASNNVGVISS